MRHSFAAFVLAVATSSLLLPAHAQRHGRSSPPTAPPPPAAPLPLVAASTGLGAIQFVQVNYGVPAPQALTRQLRFDDDRTRASALSAIGAPGQYLQHGHIPMPKAVDLELAPLSQSDELDALLTVELDQHLVTAVLVPVDGNWRRIATLIFNTPFDNAATTPDTWLNTARSLVLKDRYRAIFHASAGSMTGNFSENEAHLRIVNGKAVITISFESTARVCTFAPAPGAKQKPTGKEGCDVMHRWFQPDPADPAKHFMLLTGSGHITAKEASLPFANSRTVLFSHLRTFACQPFVFNEAAQKYDPSGPNTPCNWK